MHEAAARPAEQTGASLATLRSAVASLAGSFRDAGLQTPELDAKLLVLHSCSLSPEAYILRGDRCLSAEEAARLYGFKMRRLAHEPVSRIIGFREFWGRDFRISPAVLDPRPDTETLIEAVLAILVEEQRTASPSRILDLGTGSGCVLLTLLAELPSSWGVGADIDAAALSIARANARRFGLDDRCAFVRADWCDAFAGTFDLIVSNPPYVPTFTIGGLDESVRDYDPRRALDGGADGLDAYRLIAQSCAKLVSQAGWIVMEAGRGQAKEIVRIFADAGWNVTREALRIYQDLVGIDRVVAIKRQATF